MQPMPVNQIFGRILMTFFMLLCGGGVWIITPLNFKQLKPKVTVDEVSPNV